MAAAAPAGGHSLTLLTVNAFLDEADTISPGPGYPAVRPYTSLLSSVYLIDVVST